MSRKVALQNSAAGVAAGIGASGRETWCRSETLDFR